MPGWPSVTVRSLDEFLRQMSGPAAGLDRRLDDHLFGCVSIQFIQDRYDGPPKIVNTAIGQHSSFLVHHAHLNRILVIVQSYETCYAHHARCSC